MAWLADTFEAIAVYTRTHVCSVVSIAVFTCHSIDLPGAVLLFFQVSASASPLVPRPQCLD